MIILLLLGCFLYKLNYLQQSSILHSWLDSCHYPTLIAVTINICSTSVFVPHFNSPNICKLSQATHSRYYSDYFSFTIHPSHTSNTSSIPQILQLSLVFQQTIPNAQQRSEAKLLEYTIHTPPYPQRSPVSSLLRPPPYSPNSNNRNSH